MEAPPPYDTTASPRTSASSTAPLDSCRNSQRLHKEHKPRHEPAEGCCNLHSGGGCMNIHSDDGCMNIHSGNGCMNIHSEDGCLNIHSRDG